MRRLDDRRSLESVESVADFYLDASYDTTGRVIDTAKMLPLNDCGRPEHLKNLDPKIKGTLLKDNIRQCIDLSNGHLSGGTMDGNTEHVIVIEFQHCSKYRPKNQCHSKKKFEEDLADVKLTLEIYNNFV